MSFDGGAFLLGMLGCGVGLLLLFAVTFLIAERVRMHRVVDPAWALGFAVVAVLTLWFADGEGEISRALLVAGLVCVWGGRLAWHIIARNAGHGEDPRYAALLAKVPPAHRRAYAIRMVYLLQTALILLISLPMQVAGYSERALGGLALAGVLIWAVGFGFETVGDHQLKVFKADPANKGRIMDQGLWRFTRHPNYFGDACVWWGIWLIAAETGVGVLTIVCPIAMTFILVRGSGVALTERMMSGRPGFAEYVERTSAFFPRPPRRTRRAMSTP